MRNLLDFDTDDENALSSLNVLISDGSSLEFSPKRFTYPDANSHSNYNLLTDETPSSDVSRSKNLDVPYTFPNARRKIDSKIPTLDRREFLTGNSNNCSYDAGSSYSVANSHGGYGILSEQESEKTCEDLSRERLIPLDDSNNYEIANSHSNYQVFYNRSDRSDWDIGNDINSEEQWRKRSSNDAEDFERFQGFVRSRMKLLAFASTPGSESSHSSKSTEETSTTCDIEECLIQIEESLMNIEQNLLHVQELDIPELKSLLYESPSIEQSVHEVQDLLCTENLESAKRGQIFSSNRDNEIEKNCDDNFLQFTNQGSTSDALEYSTSVPSSTRDSAVYPNADRHVNFIPNSLGKIPSKCSFGETRENIRTQENAEKKNSSDGSVVDLINYNLNSFNEKKLVDRKNCHSRANSLDENSIFQCLENYEQRKTSLENLCSELNENYLDVNVKARSEDALGHLESAACPAVRRKVSGRTRKKSRERRIAEVEAKAEEFRRMIENIVTSRRVVKSGFEVSKRSSKPAHRGPLDVHSKSSPKTTSEEKYNETLREKEKDSPSGKPFAYDKRKRKKITSRGQSAENALVPGKIISLSLSLLLAALLQAVRCLADLVEDAFRSVSFERNGLLE